MIESVAGIMSAAPMPWIARPGDEPRVGLREADERARRREHPDAEQEDLAPAEDVAEAPAGDEQHAERQRVRADGPLERRVGRLQVRLDRRQRDVHDRVVEHDHEQREAHRRERPPAAVAVVEGHALGHAPASGRPSRIGRSAPDRRLHCAAGSVAANAAMPARRASSRRRSASRPASVASRRFWRRSSGSSRRCSSSRETSASTARLAPGSDSPSRSASSLTVSSPRASALSALTWVSVRSSSSKIA